MSKIKEKAKELLSKHSKEIGLTKELIKGVNSCINFKPAKGKVIIMAAWWVTPLTLVNKDQMLKEPPFVKIVVGKGEGVDLVEAGDIVEITRDFNMQLLNIEDNAISMRKQIDKNNQAPVIKTANKIGSKSITPVYCVEYFIIDAFGIEGVYSNVNDK